MASYENLFEELDIETRVYIETFNSNMEVHFGESLTPASLKFATIAAFVRAKQYGMTPQKLAIMCSDNLYLSQQRKETILPIGYLVPCLPNWVRDFVETNEELDVLNNLTHELPQLIEPARTENKKERE